MIKKSLLISSSTPPQSGKRFLEPHTDRGTFIVTGAQGNLGQAYLQELTNRFPNAQIYGLHRRTLTGNEVTGVTYLQADLSQRESVEKAFGDISTKPGTKTTLIHTVGMFRYEPEGKPPDEYDKDGDGIDDDIFRSNVTTTRNMLAALLQGRSHTEIAISAFSSIIKEHEFPHFGSYDRAKAQMEDDLRRVTEGYPNVSAVVLNVPTLDTPAEHDIRPFAQQSETWLPPRQLVTHSLPEILALGAEGNRGYQEVDIFTECPSFDLETFRDRHEQRWLEETGLVTVGGRYQERK